jgi:hypothetical protein
MKNGFKFTLRAVAAAFILSAFALPALAQVSSGGHVQGANDRTYDDGFNSIGMVNKRTDGTKRRDPNLAREQLKEDFARLQILDKDLAKAVSGGGTLDLRLVTKSAAEMKERARRLDENLNIPQAAHEGKRPEPEAISDQEQLKRALRALDELVKGFTHNPALTQARPDDAQLSAKARRDLREIIELSGHVKKGSEKLDKAARKPR